MPRTKRPRQASSARVVPTSTADTSSSRRSSRSRPALTLQVPPVSTPITTSSSQDLSQQSVSSLSIQDFLSLVRTEVQQQVAAIAPSSASIPSSSSAPAIVSNVGSTMTGMMCVVVRLHTIVIQCTVPSPACNRY